ncbi:hypothetical protein PLESTB_001308100 [Pleodorina starrii]|uniref:Uncharacterized protein n=1 Tax=Pleodorina starrii TaxID=330485 RepID=A0A9W6BTX1_9CHLO|nr:hypothetical protein PLESTB_001308100 [Pleodorina starrii]GLC69599.1 hypothetical protein PLESTF_000852800 [Pleodorina starrii]
MLPVLDKVQQAPFYQGSFAAGGTGGLLDDSYIPAEMRLGISVTRAKQACSEFLACASSASNAYDAMEQHSLEFKKRYYELQAALRQQAVSLAELSDGTLGSAASAPGSSPCSTLGSPTSALARTGSGVLIGPAAAAAAAAAAGPNGLSSDPSSQAPGAYGSAQLQARLSPGRGRPDAESLAALSSLLAGLENHLRVHVELEKALIIDTTPGVDGEPGAATDGVGNSSTAAAASGLLPGTAGFGQAPQQQVLHPYQIDGKVLTAEVAAVATAQDAGARGGGAGMRQSRGGRPHCSADNIVPAFMQFHSCINAVMPHVTQLAMAGENAGPPPLLQPPSHPSSHAAHVAHQLQVHANTSRQIAQLNRKVQEKTAAIGPVLRALRLEGSRTTSSHGDLSGQDFLDDDLLDIGPHLALPPALAQPVRHVNPPPPSASPKLPAGVDLSAAAARAASSGAPSAVVMGSPCSSSAGAYVAATAAQWASSASACASASASTAGLTTSGVVATSTAAAPAGTAAGSHSDEYSRLQARVRSLTMPHPAHAHAAAPASARVPDGAAAAANALLSMFSPSATLNGIGASPMAMSGQPLSATAAPTSYNFRPAGGQLEANSVFSPLRSAQPQRQGPQGFEAQRFQHPRDPEGPGSAPGAAAEVSGSGASGAASMPWQGNNAGAPTILPAAPQASWASASGRQLCNTAAAPVWMPPPQVGPDPSPASRRALDDQFRQQQQPEPQLYQGAAASTSASGLFSGPFEGAFAGRASGGGAAAAAGTSSASAPPPLWSGAEALRPIAVRTGVDRGQGVDPSGVASSSQTGWDMFQGASAPAPLSNDTWREPAAPAPIASGSGHQPSETRKVDLRGLLDDDDELDRIGGRFPGSSHGATAPADTTDNGAPKGCLPLGPFGRAAATAAQANGVVLGGALGSLSADCDTDFSLLAAEVEMYSQALMSGGLASSFSPHAAPATGSPVGLFGMGSGDGSGGTWGTFGAGGAMDIEGGDLGAAASAGTAAVPWPTQPAAFGHGDIDSGDDVVMADNDKEPSQAAFSGAKGGHAGWLGGGSVTGQGQDQAKASLFDAMGALMSPQQEDGYKPQQHAAAPAAAVAPVTTMPPPATGQLGADILALKERMRAISMK